MFAPLVSIAIDSIYDGKPLPSRMAHCTADMHAAIFALKSELKGVSADLVLSDLFRSYDMQFQANHDYMSGKKKAYSPPPGGSMHEAGRAFDLDLGKIKKLTLANFWSRAAAYGLSPIISSPDLKLSEAWHFDCRGSHDLVYKYYAAKKGDNFKSPYTAMAASAIVSTGQKVDALGAVPRPGYVQSGLIRLGQNIGDMDGGLGPKSRNGLTAIGIDATASLDKIVEQIEHKLQEAFSPEYFIPGAHIASDPKPAHLIT